MCRNDFAHDLYVAALYMLKQMDLRIFSGGNSMVISGQSLRNPYMTSKTSNNGYNTRFNRNQQESVSGSNSDIKNMKRMLANDNQNVDSTVRSTNSRYSSIQSYGEQLRAQRQQSKDTSLKMKKLKYHFKDMSSRILRSKTSAAARQVASQARREVLRLKREKQSGNYDTDDIDAAITHAKAMERVAKKKVKHLEEEEMAKVSGGVCASDEIDREENQKISEDDDNNDEILQYMTFDLQDFSDEMMQEISDGMKDMLSEMGLDELFGESTAGVDMDPQDLKELKIKHRNKEMKEIVKADSEYLKAVFNNLEKSSSNSSPISSASGTGVVTSGAVGGVVGDAGVSAASVIDVTL